MSNSDIQNLMADINPIVDIAFKKIFGVEENKDLLISLINSIVSEEDQVKDVVILNPYNPQNYKNDKLSILDIKAKGHDGKRFNVEIQIGGEAHYDKRALYYWGKLYSEQLTEGEKYYLLNKSIGIHILNVNYIADSENYHNVFRIQGTGTNLNYFNDLELHTIELQKFKKEVGDELSTLMSKVKDKIDLWAAFLTKHNLLDKDNLPTQFNTPDIKKALNILEVMNLSKDEREDYEGRLKWIRMEYGTILRCEEEARAKGLAEGWVAGKIEGKAEGAKNQAIDIAKLMLAKNKPVEEILEFTGISESELISIK